MSKDNKPYANITTQKNGRVEVYIDYYLGTGAPCTFHSFLWIDDNTGALVEHVVIDEWNDGRFDGESNDAVRFCNSARSAAADLARMLCCTIHESRKTRQEVTSRL